MTKITAHQWNDLYAIGTPVRYCPIMGSAERRTTKTRSEAWSLGDGSVVVKIDGQSGCVAVEHLSPLSIDPDAFTFPEPKILIGAGECMTVHEALCWRRPERRDEEEKDPIFSMWTPRNLAHLQSAHYGYTHRQLRDTLDELMIVIKDPQYTENPTRDCQRAVDIVAYAMFRLKQGR